MHNLLTRRLEWFLRERWFVLNFHKTIQTGEGGVPSLLSRLLFAPSCVYTARLREIGTGISEASKRAKPTVMGSQHNHENVHSGRS